MFVGSRIALHHDIHTALDVGETWLRQAEEGDRLARTYGEGGEHQARHVVEELAAIRHPPLGSGKLLRFLSNWEASRRI